MDRDFSFLDGPTLNPGGGPRVPGQTTVVPAAPRVTPPPAAAPSAPVGRPAAAGGILSGGAPRGPMAPQAPVVGPAPAPAQPPAPATSVPAPQPPAVQTPAAPAPQPVQPAAPAAPPPAPAPAPSVEVPVSGPAVQFPGIPSRSDLRKYPEGVSMATPYGPIVTDPTTGRRSIKLTPEGQQLYVRDRDAHISRIPPNAFTGDPNAPKPDIQPGRTFYDPFSGRFID